MASKKILVQLDIAAASNLTSPLGGYIGFSAKADGLYQKIGTSPELRLLTSADVQNAILADGSITGAVSQAQTFTLGVKLSNLTQGYIPYASGATKLLSNSPIYTDGTRVGIGITLPNERLHVYENGTDNRWYGRAIFGNQNYVALLGTYNNAAVVGAHNAALNAWAPLYINTVPALDGGGSVIMYGNVGIGTTNTNVKLTVGGNIQILNTSVWGATNTTIGSLQWQSSVRNEPASFANIEAVTDSTYHYKGHLVFKTNDIDGSNPSSPPTEKMRILGNGNVGIGRMAPATQLHLSGIGADQRVPGGNYTNTIRLSDRYADNFGSGGELQFGFDNGSNAVLSIIKGTYEIWGATTLGGGLHFYTRPADGDLSERLTIKYDGNVGIGTPAPNQQLEITKNFRLPSTIGTTPYGIIYKDTTPFIHDFNYGNNGTVTTLGRNTFVGINAGNLTMGSTATQTYHASNNTGIGYQSLFSNTTGSNNVATGSYSLYSNTIGNYNTANGYQSLYSNTIGHSNTANGYASLYYNTTGNDNTANGRGSFSSNTIGSNNTALGSSAGRYLANGATGRTTGDNGLYLGYNTKASADGTDNEIVIGYNAIGAGSNKTVIGNSSVTDTYFGSSTGASKLWASALNLSGLTASKVVFTDASKNLTSTGIGTASQFIKGDGSLDSNTYLTTGTTIITGSGVDSRITFWSGTNSLSSTSSLGWNDTTKNLGVTGGIVANSVSASISVSTNLLLTNSFSLIATTTAGYVLTTDAYGNGTWQAPTGGGSYTLPTATASVLGGVKIGSGITISSGVISVSTNYQAPITTGTTAQYLRGDLSLAIFPTINTGSGVNGRITFWDGTNSLSSSANLTWDNTNSRLIVFSIYSAYSFKLGSSTTAGYVLTADANGNGTWQAPGGSITGSGVNGRLTFWSGTNSLSSTSNLEWNNTTKNLGVTGGVVANSVSASISVSTNLLLTNSFSLIATTTAGYVLTTDANGNGTWQAPPTGGGSYTLPIATASVLGGVKIGSGITISSGVISVSTNYEAPLTFTNGLSRTGNTVSFSGSSSYVPYTGANNNVDVGSYVMYANNFVLNSDINLKCNIESIEIKNIDIDYKKYEFKSLVGDIRYGVIAQELLKVAPELVSSTPNNTFSVKYIDLLIHEIAYLKQEIKKLTGGN